MTNNTASLSDLLLYDVWGDIIVFNIPFIALSVYIGWKGTHSALKNSKIGDKVVKTISILVSIGIFAILKSFTNNG